VHNVRIYELLAPNCVNIKILLLNITHIITCELDSSEKQAECLIPGRNKRVFNSQHPDLLWGTPSYCLVDTRDSCHQWLKWLGHEAGHSPPLCTEVKNACSVLYKKNIFTQRNP
jgi:hypothetical protein